jgi:hypothetical protein
MSRDAPTVTALRVGLLLFLLCGALIRCWQVRADASKRRQKSSSSEGSGGGAADAADHQEKVLA